MSDEDAAAAKAKAVRNETAKLGATYINGLAVGIFIVGCVAPSLTYVFAHEASRPPASAVVIAIALCFGLSIALHLIAKRELKAIEPWPLLNISSSWSAPPPACAILMAMIVHYANKPRAR